MTYRRISPLRPGQDQTLLSFLRGAQEDAGYSEDGFTNLLAGAPLSDSRLAERRSFDWHSLERFFNASAEELFRLSERSLYYRMEDVSRGAVLHQRAPWTAAHGYGARVVHGMLLLVRDENLDKPATLVAERLGVSTDEVYVARKRLATLVGKYLKQAKEAE